MIVAPVLQAVCPRCKRALRVPRMWLDQTVKCKFCGQPFRGHQPAPRAVPAVPPVRLHPARMHHPHGRRRGGRWKGLVVAAFLLGMAAALAVVAWPVLREALSTPATETEARLHDVPRDEPRTAVVPEAPRPAADMSKKIGTGPKKNAGDVPKKGSDVVVRKPPPRGPRPRPDPEKTNRALYQTAGPNGAESLAGPAGGSRIDELVLAQLRARDIPPAAPCSDTVFVRRVYLDVIGRLPTAQEAKGFLDDSDPDKRRLLIDRLLERPEFADYWAMKWGDLLRVKSEFPIKLWPNAVQAYHRWIRTAVRENRPYDQFVRALLTSSGSNFREPPVNFYRALQRKDGRTIAHAVGLTFMGVRPEGWPRERWEGMAAFFAQVGYKGTAEWKEEIVFFDPTRPRDPGPAVFPDGTKAEIAPGQDPRQVFADWLIAPQNPWFTRNIANRVWSWLLGRGIIHDPDDVRPDNPPSNPELLAYLEQELMAARYDLKALFRLILNSRTYQLSSIPASKHPEAAALFASYPIRRLEAEVLIDAICQITGTTEKYSSPIPEPFTYIPENQRSVALMDGSITSAFLELFGRPPRDTGLESERNNNFTPALRLHLLNSSHIQQKLEQGPALQALLASGKPREIANELYLTILSRLPTEDELSIVESHFVGGSAFGRRPGVDVAWALINSAEFLCRH